MARYIKQRAFIERRLITPRLFARIQKDLIYIDYRRDVVRSTQAYKDAQLGSTQADKLEIHNYWRNGRYVSLPRKWAIDNIPHALEDRTKFPRCLSLRHSKRVQPRDDQQRKFFTELRKQAIKPGPQHILANAKTGAGKTVAQIWLGQQLETRTLLVVDSNKIAAGYIKNFVKFFGQEWTDRNVGRIQQDRCDIDKPYVIAMVQSLVSRHYHAAYQAFGLVCYDEVQIYGNLAYHRALGMFNARVLAGFTATNKGGSFGKVITGYIGKPAVESSQDVMAADAHVITYKLPRLINTFSDGTVINDLTSISDRNDIIAQMLVNEAWKRKRVCLVLSDRTAQLQAIQKRLIKLKVPAKAIGLHVGEYEDGTWTVGYSYDRERWIKTKYSVSHKEAIMMADMLNAAKIRKPGQLPTALLKKMSNGEQVYFEAIRNTVKPSNEELDSIANSCYFILATYRIFGKGVDYPRIDMGVEASPKGSVIQALGRVTRLLDSKPKPEWWCLYDRFVLEQSKVERFGTDDSSIDGVVDTVNAFFDATHRSRKEGLKKVGANIIYHKADEYRSNK